MGKLRLFTIVPLNVEYVDEICADIKQQCEQGVADCALFSMYLVPEGTPPVDKATPFCEKYSVFKQKLDKLGVKSGILVQSSMGHGRALNETSSFQKCESFAAVNGDVCCPYDDEFCDYVREVFTMLASQHPNVIMIDDDYRLMSRAGGCACPLHLAAFNRIAGTMLTKDELHDHLARGENDGYIKIFIETQRDALIKAARAMREGIDRIDPSIQGMFCGMGNHLEFAEEIASVLAGEGNPVVVRINNGNYTPMGARNLSGISYRAAVQIAHIKDKVDVILAETDTCPQNRYSTGAQSLHSHFIASILEGVKGAKHWITRMNTHEPESGRAYRKVLANYQKMYEALAVLEPRLKWMGCRIPITVRRAFYFNENNWSEWDGGHGWSSYVLERLGLPLYFSTQDGGAVFLSEKSDQKFTDEEILSLFHGTVFLSSDVAERLLDRGFGKYIGVDVSKWEGKRPSTEQFLNNNKSCAPQKAIKELIPMNEKVEIDSMVMHTVDRESYEPLFPGTTVYKNQIGGTTIVFCGSPVTKFSFLEGFSFLNESRKQQFVRLLKGCGHLPVYYASDEEMYLRVARMNDGKLFCCLFNIGLDPIEEIVLAVEQEVRKVEKMSNEGQWEDCSFRMEEERIIVETPAYTLNPVVLRLSVR